MMDCLNPLFSDNPDYDEYYCHLRYLIECYWKALLEKKKILINERIDDLKKDFQ